MNPNVPGSAKMGRDRTGMTSATRVPSTAAAPTKLLPGVATKKNDCRAGVPSSNSVSGRACHMGSATASMRWAMVSVVSKLYPGGGMIRPNTRFRLPSGRYSSLGRKVIAASVAPVAMAPTMIKPATRNRTVNRT